MGLRAWWQRASRRQPSPGNKNRQLWGQDFRVVKEGLDEAQVVGFVSDLLAQYRARSEQEAPPRTPSQRGGLGAEREVAALRLKAKREGEVEAARIIAQAKQQAQDLLDQAQRQVGTYTQKQVEEVILTAKKKAELTEKQAQQTAQVLLLQAREEIQSHLTNEAKEAYYRLLSTLQELLTTARGIESDWKTRTVQLWESPALALGEYEPGLLGSPGSQQLPGQTLVEEEAEAVGVAEEPVQPLAQGVEAKAAEAPQPRPLTEEILLVAEVQAQSGEKVPPQEDSLKAVESAEEDQKRRLRLYSGEVELVVEPPVDVIKVSELYNHLQALPELKVLRTVGSWDRGTVLTIRLDRPLPLISLLETIPLVEVKPTSQIAPDGKGKADQRVGITFKGSEHPH